MKKKLLLTVGIAFSIMFSALPAVHADLNEETYYPDVKNEPGWMGITLDNSIGLLEPSRLFAQLFPYGGEIKGQKLVLCNSTQDSACKDPEYSYLFHSNLSACLSDTELDCIQEIGELKEDGTVIDAVHVTDYSNNGNFEADPSIGLPAGHGPNIWKINNGGIEQKLAVVVGLDGNWVRGKAKVNLSGFSSSIQPVIEVTGSEYRAPNVMVMKRSFGDGPGWDTMALVKGCQIYETGKCAMRQSFDLSKKYFLKVRLSQPITGWLHGRMRDATIEVKTNSDYSSLVTISAKPLQVPMVNGWSKWDDLPANVKALYPVGTGGTARVLSDFTTTDLSSRTMLTQSMVAGQQAINEMNAWLPLLSDKANNMKSLWSARSMNGQLPIDLNRCPSAGGLTGIVGTNAAVYSDGPPSFDAATGSLNYTVGAPHFDSKGIVFGGFYQLNLRSDVARCIYGFSNAPISAKVDIASADGTPRVAVTTLSEKNGWLNLTAAGFEFSTPKIAVKLIQEASKVVTPSKVVVKKITCVKGKVSRVVTTATCPSGYKKK